MYFYLHESHSRFTRLLETQEKDELPDLQEELSKTTYNYTIHGQNNINLQNIKLAIYNFDEKSHTLYQIATKYLMQVEAVLLQPNNSSPDMVDIHEYITNLLKLHKYLLAKKKLDELGNISLMQFKNKITKFTELPEFAIQKLTRMHMSAKHHHQDSNISQYFHFMLDIKWLLVEIASETSEDKSNANESCLVLELMQELHYIMYKTYEKTNQFTEICKCVRVLWLQIQLHCEKMRFSFWEMFNSSMTCYNEEYALYMLKFLADLQCYSHEGKYIGSTCLRIEENIDFCNKSWNQLLKNENVEAKICKVLAHIENLLTDLWLGSAKLDFFYYTWDYYYKKIEVVTDPRTFQQVLNELDGDNHFSSVSMYCKESPKLAGTSAVMNGYLLFIRMLKRHFGRHPNHWNKFKGRIYTKFPLSKFQKLNDQGLQNLALVFFEVAFVHFDEISGKFLGLLKDLPKNRQHSSCAWSIYIYLMKQHLDHQKVLTPVFTIFGPLLEEASRTRTLFHLLSTFANSLPSYFRCDDLTLQQHLLIGPWLDNYIKSCIQNDLISLLNTLSAIIERTVDAGVWYIYQPAFVTHVLHPICRLSINQSIIGTVAGLIIANSEGLDYIVEQFISETVPGDVMMSFFMTLRRKSFYSTNERREFLTMKAWFLSWFIGVNNVSFTQDVHAMMLNDHSHELTKTQDPFELFLKTITKPKLQACLRDSERFFAKNLNLHVYTNMALVLHTRGEAIYTRATTTCYLSVFFDQFLLPMEVLRGSKPSFLSMVEKTWHLFMFSLWKINSESDPYLERLLKDLTVRYIPHFSTKPTVLLKILQNQSLSKFVFSKISSEFFEYNPGKHVADESLFKALSIVTVILDELLGSSQQNNDMIVLFANSFLVSLYEVYMFKNHKVAVMDIVKKLAVLRSGDSKVAQIFGDSFLAVMRKHMAFSTNQFFQMAYVLVKVVGDVVSSLLGKIKEEISRLECKRGQGFDNHLRQSFDKLRKLC